MKSKKVQILIAVIIGLVCLYFFARGMDWKMVWQSVINANYFYVVAAILLQYVAMWIRALRWQSFLGEPRVSVSKMFMIANIGFMGNGVLPARLGELIRPFLVWRNGTHSFSTALATIVVERVFDLLGILLVMAYVLYTFEFPAAEGVAAIQENVKLFALIGLFLFAMLSVAIGFMAYAPALSLRIAGILFYPLPEGLTSKLLKAIEAFEQGASTFRRPSSALYCVFLTLALWILIAYSEWILLWAFHIETVNFTGALFLMCILCFAVMFPQMPGYIGPYQLAVQKSLEILFAVPESTAGAVAIVMWLTQVPPIILMGFICLVIMGISFSDITHVKEEIPVDAEPPQQPRTQDDSTPAVT